MVLVTQCQFCCITNTQQLVTAATVALQRASLQGDLQKAVQRESATKQERDEALLEQRDAAQALQDIQKHKDVVQQRLSVVQGDLATEAEVHVIF